MLAADVQDAFLLFLTLKRDKSEHTKKKMKCSHNKNSWGKEQNNNSQGEDNFSNDRRSKKYAGKLEAFSLRNWPRNNISDRISKLCSSIH